MDSTALPKQPLRAGLSSEPQETPRRKGRRAQEEGVLWDVGIPVPARWLHGAKRVVGLTEPVR